MKSRLAFKINFWKLSQYPPFVSHYAYATVCTVYYTVLYLIIITVTTVLIILILRIIK